jgi:hypothetical protein
MMVHLFCWFNPELWLQAKTVGQRFSQQDVRAYATALQLETLTSAFPNALALKAEAQGYVLPIGEK